MTETLVHGRYVIKGIADGNLPDLIEDGAVLMRDGIIVEVGPLDAFRERAPGATLIGGRSIVVSPGFVNAHHHVGLTPFQLGAPDMPLELWMVRQLACRSVDPYLDTLYSAMEMLESGVTTVQHLQGRATRPVSRIFDVSDRIVGAYRDIGMRASYSFAIRDQCRIVCEDDTLFLKRLAPELAAKTARFLADRTFRFAELCEVFEELHTRYAALDRIKVQMAPANLHWCSDEALTGMADLARRFGVPMHMHLLETPIQREYASRRTGRSAVRHLHNLGLLGPDLTLGHAVWSSDSDMDLLAETGTCVCHNCSSNMRLRSGTAPLNGLRKRGVTVALGIDEAGINDDRDMLQEMRLIRNVHRTPGTDAGDVPSFAEIFRMATSDGARTTPFKDSIGSIAPGKAADLVLFDWDKIAKPYLSPDVPVVDAVIQRARRRDGVHSVIVGGEILFEAGRFTRIDKDQVMSDIASRMAEPLTGAERDMRELSAALLAQTGSFLEEFSGGRIDGFRFGRAT